MISIEKLKERKLVQWAMAYLAAAWLVLQLASLLADAYAWSPEILRFLPFLLAVGFLAALILSWYHGEKGQQRVSTIELAMLTTLLLIAGVGVMVLGRGRDANAASPAGADVARMAALPTEQGSIAVLPFENMSADVNNEYFSDGLSEELLNALAQLPELRVAARTSSFSFKGKGVGIDSIGRALNVAHVLEGSVRKAGERVRITAQLIDARTGYHLWSETYNRNLADIFAVQDEISRAIVKALRIQLGGGESPLVAQETAVPEAHTLVLRADHLNNQSTRESLAEGTRLLMEALELDPDYARAHALLAESYGYRADNRWIPPDEGYAKAKAHARRALSIDPRMATADVTLAEIASSQEWDWAAAAEHLERALVHDPGDAKAYGLRALLLAQRGNRAAAVASARRSYALDPVSLGAVTVLAEIYRYTDHPQLALDTYETALTLQGDHPITLGNLALTHAVAGRHADAVAAAEAAVETAPQYAYAHSTLAYAQARAGQRDAAERSIAVLAALPDVLLYDLATAHAGLGNADAMFELLERAVDEREAYVPLLGIDPVFEPYRTDARTRRLLDRMGLPHG